ncbi:3'(2'),5'-bisphosphate nucleotidase CysQ, partial [Campylobacter jejuni]|nr:3'(2'),5'-bisphosphate nucleotidase CysQ [Campylobacter jejuni]
MLEKINLDEIKSIVLKAGKAVMEIYNKDFKVSYKDDNSPLTEANL